MELKYKKSKVTPDLTPEKNKLSLEKTNKLLGLNLNEKQLKTLIEKMGHNYSKTAIESPAWRMDLLHEVDLIEDVAIAYGYNKFEPEIPEIATIGQEDPKETFKRNISTILAGLNMLEISNYHLTNKKDQFTKMGIPEKQEKGFIEVEESKTDYTILRKDLTHYALKILAENVDSEYPQKIFESGKVFTVEKSDIIEKENLSAAIAPGNFTEIKQILEYLANMSDIKITFEEEDNIPQHFIKGRIAKILLDNKQIGLIGEIHPKILKNWKIKMPVALFELELDKIF
jgi:phenylalanyl-tRNA synthetase beta chain